MTTAPKAAPERAGIDREATFLLDRLSEFENEHLREEDGSARAFYGHVEPSMERLRAMLAAAPSPTDQGAPGTTKDTETVAYEAYQVIGSLAQTAGRFGDPEVTRALDYFAYDQWKEPGREVLPFVLSDQADNRKEVMGHGAPQGLSDHVASPRPEHDTAGGAGWRSLFADPPTPGQHVVVRQPKSYGHWYATMLIRPRSEDGHHTDGDSILHYNGDQFVRAFLGSPDMEWCPADRFSPATSPAGGAAPRVRPLDGDALVEALAQHLHDEEFANHKGNGWTWPEHAEDEGYRGREGNPAWVTITPTDVQFECREAAARIVGFVKRRLAPTPSADPAAADAGDDLARLSAAATALLQGFTGLEESLAQQDADIPDGEPLWVKAGGRRHEIGTYGALRNLDHAVRSGRLTPARVPARDAVARIRRAFPDLTASEAEAAAEVMFPELLRDGAILALTAQPNPGAGQAGGASGAEAGR